MATFSFLWLYLANIQVSICRAIGPLLLFFVFFFVVCNWSTCYDIAYSIVNFLYVSFSELIVSLVTRAPSFLLSITGTFHCGFCSDGVSLGA